MSRLGPARLLPLLVALAASGCFLIPEEDNELAPPVVRAPEVSYDVMEIKPRNFVKKVSMSGVLASRRQENLFFRYQGGRLVHVHVYPDDEIRAGEVIAELSLGDLVDQVELKRIALERAELQLARLRALGSTSFDIDLAELSVREAEVQLRMAQNRLADLRLVSPLDGIVTFVGPEEGDYVQPFEIVATVVDPADLILECGSDKARDFPRGTIVDVELGDTVCTGRVISNPLDDPDPEYRIQAEEDRILIEIADLPPDAAMYDTGIVNLILARREDTIVVPKYVLRSYAGRTFVNVLNDGVKVEQDVELGIETATEVEITKGLSPGDLVVTR